MTQRFDLVIVGASFAGLACARTAALRGLAVAVLEAKPEPGARVHTTGILVREAADELDLPHELTRRVHGVRLHAPGGRHWDLFAPGYYFLTTRTAALLRWMAAEARRAGAQIRCGCPFRGSERIGGAIRLAGLDIEARFLVGADGARSRVAQAFDLGRNRRFLVGVEAEYRNLHGVDPRFLHCFVDSALAPGYIGWAAPGPNVIQVGLAASCGRAPDLAAFKARTAHIFSYETAEVVERRSGRIPCGGPVSPIGAPGVVLVGDAAGLVSPMTGGGIRLAFRSGRRAAQAISDRLLSAGPEPYLVLAREYPRFALKKLLRAGMDLAPPNRIVECALACPGAAGVARRLYFHSRGAPGLAWRDYEKRLAAEIGRT